MTNISIGRFNYSFIPTIDGNYLSTVKCNISGILGYDEESFYVEGETKMIGTGIIDFTKVIFVIFLFCVHLILIILGIRYRLQTLIFIGGMLGIVSSLIVITQMGLAHLLGATIFFSAYTVICAGFCSMQLWSRYSNE
jgi:hypothetical protein